jgi:hypothetical protein
MWIFSDMDPLRAADELGDIAARPGERLGDLHTAGAAADNAPALADIGHTVIPARRVKRRTGETLAPRNVRKERFVEKARGADENIRNVRIALGGLDVPATVGEPRCDDLLVEADEFGEAAGARHLLDISPDLGGRRIFARPVIVGLERKLVLARQDVDKEAGKGIVSPGAADLAGLLIDGEIDPSALQRLGHEQPRYARAGDDNAKFAISHHTSLYRPVEV